MYILEALNRLTRDKNLKKRSTGVLLMFLDG